MRGQTPILKAALLWVKGCPAASHVREKVREDQGMDAAPPWPIGSQSAARPSARRKIITPRRLRQWVASFFFFFSTNVFLIKGEKIVYFRHNVISHLKDYSIV